MFFLCTSETHGLALHFLAQALDAAVTNQAASHEAVYPTENWSPCLDKPLCCHSQPTYGVQVSPPQMGLVTSR